MRDYIVRLLNESTRMDTVDAKGAVTLAGDDHVTALTGMGDIANYWEDE